MITARRPQFSSVHPAALVARAPGFRESSDLYLVLSEDGRTTWVEDPQAATAFPSMREAARMAFRLPSALKAYGLPRESEITLRYDLH